MRNEGVPPVTPGRLDKQGRVDEEPAGRVPGGA